MIHFFLIIKLIHIICINFILRVKVVIKLLLHFFQLIIFLKIISLIKHMVNVI